MSPLFYLVTLAGLALGSPEPPVPAPEVALTCEASDAAAGACCRVCTRGKACGNSCIAAHLTCRRGAGCACNAGEARRSSSASGGAAAASEDVREAQRLLNQLGYDVGPPDGVMGARTRAALRQFQTDQRLGADGVPGPATLSRLRSEARRRQRNRRPRVTSTAGRSSIPRAARLGY